MMSRTDEILDDAFAAYNKDDLETAEALAREALTLEPNHGDALFLLGLIAYRAGALKPAEELMYQAAHSYPDILKYQMALAGILTAAKRYQDALALYDKHADVPEALLQKAYIYLATGEEKEAEAAFLKAKEAGVAEAVLGLAELKRRAGHLKQARALLKKAPFVGNTFYQLSLIDTAEKKYEDALFNITQAIGLQAWDIYALQKGVVLEKTGDLEGALSAYQQAHDLNPYNAVALMNEANIYLKQGHNRWAEEYYKRALQQDNTLWDAYQNLAALLVREGRLTEALEHYRAILIKRPKDVAVLYNLALILEEVGETVEAVGLYFNILSLGGKIRGLEARLAAALKRLFDDKKTRALALDYAKGWVKSFPTSKTAAKLSAFLAEN